MVQTLKGYVQNGRLVLDEPTDLPDGTEVELHIDVGEAEPEDRAKLDAKLAYPPKLAVPLGHFGMV